jgi:hypothetical protein
VASFAGRTLRIFALASVLGMAAAGLSAGSAAPARAATSSQLATLSTATPSTLESCGTASDGTPEYCINASAPGPGDIVAHACVAVGTDQYGNQEVECADVYAVGVSGGVAVYPGAEGICQNSGSTVSCAGNEISFSLNDSSEDNITGLWLGECGHYGNGPCADDARNYWYSDNPYLFVPADSCSAELWTVVWAGSIVEAPHSADSFANATNFGSGHVIVCANAV